jgi:hypothetical protein
LAGAQWLTNHLPVHSKALEKMNPLDTDKLKQLLSGLDTAELGRRAGASSMPSDDADNSEDRLQTSSPLPPEDPIDRERRKRARLIRDGGRPALPMEQLGSLSTMTRESIARAALWVDLPKRKHPPTTTRHTLRCCLCF